MERDVVILTESSRPAPWEVDPAASQVSGYPEL